MNINSGNWEKTIILVNSKIQDAVISLDKSAVKIVIVVNENGILEGTISDGDIRRGLLRGLNLKSPIIDIIHKKPLVVSPEISSKIVRELMSVNKIQQIPVVDEHNYVVGLHLWDEIAISPSRPNLVVIMAGGKGIRLRPYTENCPKPMLNVSGKPILEHIIERAKQEGFNRFVIAIHYLGKIVEDYFGNGESLHVKIDYLRERSPLGTAGALGLLNTCPDFPFLVTNGDVLTEIHYGELLDFHMNYNAVGTMAVRVHEWQNPYGVVQTTGVDIVGFEEKPVYRSYINAGVYALNPESLSYLEKDSHCDMPTLFERIQLNGKRTAAYPIHEPWLDVGIAADLRQANLNVIDEYERKK